ncbi:fumarate reductase (quinol) flavoprotein subunit [Tardiphaga sp. vice352]|uniref:fumarate reductase (quinol) flavoprotein subunit n=1 Tax=unclassified Tardiphaga TaxID=2631404 RepID=UPI001164D874|nr:MULTISPECIES: fumarate reductase (quinol) flavoprotein subunit [unclassified Tardiphaga]QDM16612.1 fumarate reductase (quinol) flavoprotein subunit [Tardiphaga sp. vice278]QDM31886.1 fumarate reductase (quinol) flavoprotein subunit [Tardiphaga sp. vice352]
MHHFDADVLILGAGGAGLRAAIAAAESAPELTVALVSKVYPMRSHTVAAEGGSAGVVQAHDTLDNHFNDTVSGGDWLCEQDVVEYFVEHCTREMVQLEHWGCPWSRKPDGNINVRAFGGMKIERTWFAADRSGFHILHTLFQTSTRFPSIKRFDEFFCVDLLVEDGRIHGAVMLSLATGEFTTIHARAVVVATGGAGRAFRQNTNGGIVTGDGMAMAYRHGVPLRDMEFVQYHPTCLPGTGILITEACRGEGGFLLNKDGRRYLEDYGLGPADAKPRNKYMELGPRDRLSQAFWHEQRKGNTVTTPQGEAVMLDLRHLGRAKILERLPLIAELAEKFMGVDPAEAPIPVRPAVHYTMGGIEVDINTASPLAGLYAAGECSSVGIHGANRLGSNSLAELSVFGRVAGEQAALFARGSSAARRSDLAGAVEAKALALLDQKGQGEHHAKLRAEMGASMEKGCGIYRLGPEMQETCDKLGELKQRYAGVTLEDKSRAWNTDWVTAIELGFQLDVAQAMAHSAVARTESRGAHQRLDGYETRDDANFLRHSLAHYQGDAAPAITYQAVKITKSPPGQRAYGAAGEHEEAAQKGVPVNAPRAPDSKDAANV